MKIGSLDSLRAGSLVMVRLAPFTILAEVRYCLRVDRTGYECGLRIAAANWPADNTPVSVEDLWIATAPES
jgi:hypothetical protein